MRKLISLLAVASLMAAVGAVAAFGATSTVSWKTPSKKTVTIHKGSTVKWVWTDRELHNVAGPGVKKNNPVARKGKTLSKTFRTKGTFRYVCQVHATSMKTTVKVI
jgi:plastocyanin